MRTLPARAEAALALVIAQVAVRLVPFRWLAPCVTDACLEPSDTIVAERRAAVAGRLIVSMAERLPWQSTCLVRSLAARMVLARMGIPSVLCLGVTTQDGALRAHAWLLAGGGIVCGGREASGYRPIAAITRRRGA